MTYDKVLELLTPEFLQWAANLTETFQLSYNKDEEQYYIDDKNLDSMSIEMMFESEYITKLQAFIYQAIDGINDTRKWYLNPFAFGGVDIFYNYELMKPSSYCDYPSPTIARLEALKWIWQQEAKS